MGRDRDAAACLCLYGSGEALLDCFELVRQAGPDTVFAGVRLAAAPAAPHAGAAREAAELGVVWHESLAAMLAAEPAGLLVPLDEETPLPAEAVLGRETMPRQGAELLFRLVARAATHDSCRPDLFRARRLLATVLDRIDEELALVAPDGRILDANASLAKRLERSREALVGLPAAGVFPDFPDLAAPGGDGGPSILEHLATGRKMSRESSRVDARGRLRYFRMTFHPVPGPDGSLAHLVALRRDITEDVFLERRLRKSERLAAIGELSMYISHEIRNPLFAIAGFANALIRAGDLGDSSREKASIILDESRRLENILNEINMFARPSGTASGEVNVGEVVLGTTSLLRHALESQGISVELRLDPGIPNVRGDADTLTQCLLNCLHNAKDAMPEGGRITISTAFADGRVSLVVADDGEGIPPDILPRVFNPFFTTREKHSGLGLAMTRKILEDLGGSVELESEPGRGTAVTLLLPPFLEPFSEDA